MELIGTERCKIRILNGPPCGEPATRMSDKWCDCGEDHRRGHGQIASFHCEKHHDAAQALMDSLDVYRIVHRIP